MNRMPGKLKAIVIMNLIDGVLNLLWGLALATGLVGSIVGILCLPLAFYPLILGTLQLIYAFPALDGGGELSRRPLKWLAGMQIGNLIVLDVISPIIGVISLVLYDDGEVREYYEGN